VNFVVVFLASYLVGSIPTAYLFVKSKAGIDIRKAGSGNVGAFNTYDVTKSKRSGIIVGFLDALKGFAVVAVLGWILRVPFESLATGFVATILGHNYPVWLNFKGGRGLATAAGGLFAIGVIYTVIWCLFWLIIYRIRKNIHAGNLAATIATPLVLLAVPASWIERTMFVGGSGQSYQILAFVLSFIVFLSHLDVVNELRIKRRLGNE
jgi:glycerol-3-phosphate acyltransferase PlsY